MNAFVDVLKNTFFGPGAFEDPQEAFKMYAPPGLLDVFTPEQQIAYGRQIQSQMRNINADTRPQFANVQKSIVDAAKEKRGLELSRELQTELGTAFGRPSPSAAAPDATPGAAPAPVVQPIAPGANAPMAGQPPAPAQGNPRRARAQQYLQAAQVFAARGDGEQAKRYIDIAMQLNPNPSEAVRDLEYFGFNMEGMGQAAFGNVKAYNESKANKTTNILNAANKGEAAYVESLAKELPALASQAQLAQRTNQSLSEIVANENRPTFTGLLAPGQIGATQFLKSLGLDVKPETLANSREFQAAANILVLDFMGAMGGARGFSKEESAILYDAFPKIIDSPEARSRIARMLIRRNNSLIQDYNSTRGEFEKFLGKSTPSPKISPLELNTSPRTDGAPVPRYDPKTGKFN
jgi:hypothetical protein